MDLLNLSKEESLNLLNLRKDSLNTMCMGFPVLNGLKSRVSLIIDYSGSMSGLFKRGVVQATLERILPLALQFDDNFELEVWLFENSFQRLPNVTMENYYGYIEEYVIGKYRMGGTEYAPVLNDVYKKYIIEEPSDLPTYVIFITDGANSDRTAATEIVKKMSNFPIFLQFIGIGNSTFPFLEKLDDMDGRYVDNADFFKVVDINQMSDSHLYGKLLTEYPFWLQYPEVRAMLEEGKYGPVSKPKKGLFGKLFG